MKNISILMILLIGLSTQAQLSFKQQKAFQNYASAVNALSEETYHAINCLHQYSDAMKKKGSIMSLPKLSCANQIPAYPFDTALKESAALPAATASALNTDLKAIYERYEILMNSTRVLEAYTNMKDYQTDQFAKAKLLIEEAQTQILMMRREISSFEQSLFIRIGQLQGTPRDPKVAQARNFIYQTVQEERALLDLFFQNFNTENFSGQFPTERLQAHVNQLDIKLSGFKFVNTMPYPANYQFDRFVETLKKDMQAMKRDLINGYTAKEQSDDDYANKALASLLNYYNNLVSIQNTFADALRQQQLSNEFVMYGFRYFPVFRYNLYKAAPKQVKVFFKDKAIEPLQVAAQAVAIRAEPAEALNNYIRFVNRALQINSYLPGKLKELNQTCNQLMLKGGCEVIAAKGYLFYSDMSSDYQIPKAEYEKAINDSRYLPAGVKKSLNEQAAALMDILKEKEQLLADLSSYEKSGAYKTDCLRHSYELLDRFELLIESFHLRKERLYGDLTQVFHSYKVAEPNNSWTIAGKALWQTAEECKQVALSAREYLLHTSDSYKKSDTLAELVRAATYDKYKNLKGIHELGRSNGHCPYSHYDDLLRDCQIYLERTKEFEKRLAASKPDSVKVYYDYLYLYNSLSDDYNDFVEIARGDASGYYEIDKYNPAGKKLNYMHMLEQIQEPMYFRVARASLPKDSDAQVKQTPLVQLPKGSVDTLSMEGYALNNLVLLIDVSYSMSQPDKMPLLKESLGRLLMLLRPSDQISIVAFSNTATILLKPSSSQSNKIKEVLEHIKPGGGTNISAGLAKAYQVAQEGFISGGNNRVILATDGEFVINEVMRKHADAQSAADIKLSVFSYGRIQASESLKTLADRGKGNYEIITPDNSDVKLLGEAKAKKKP